MKDEISLDSLYGDENFDLDKTLNEIYSEGGIESNYSMEDTVCVNMMIIRYVY